ncbi:hypothetical protein [Caulobacter sp.]|uniref:hypothetical protein n=1 Tax=Caulobacter sp. TaxID=78 RepID=UPI001B0237CB|nr:hypothetical protein [Caulobacter sp.]MBO9543848.1 hypothetical protein [Caulobacter sp.]
MPKRTLADLVLIATYGGGFDLSANDYTYEELVKAADALCNGASMRVFHTDGLTTEQLSIIAQHGGPGGVQFVFVA